MKYIGRIKNGDKRAPEDIIKVATYAFIYWIKMFTKENKKNPCTTFIKEEPSKKNSYTHIYKFPKDISYECLLKFRKELEKDVQQYTIPYCPGWWK